MIDAGEEPENKEEVHVDTCIRSTSTGKRTQIQAYAFSAESEEKTVEFLDKMVVFITKRPQNIPTLPTRERYCRSLHKNWAQNVNFNNI